MEFMLDNMRQRAPEQVPVSGGHRADNRKRVCFAYAGVHNRAPGVPQRSMSGRLCRLVGSVEFMLKRDQDSHLRCGFSREMGRCFMPNCSKRGLCAIQQSSGFSRENV
eukprot:gnl/TRDRNA2_/TRDRNA2_93181_c0_seq1.p2 gnl/TRDRNA2_/TRDRNA2_93181_c0~~gnl/TRDRNA2_/TRDRNA2_93181_c0_seq1.p2  ORF type:complete len:108 (+),score=3.33 gnl/TRDRNA2_/TRDRNA2_93181_c0_seq1:330-653(+)